MELDVLDQIQLISDEGYNHLFLGNTEGYISFPLDKRKSGMIMNSIYHHPNPLAIDGRKMLDFCGVKNNIQIEIVSQIQNSYLALLTVGDEPIGKYPIDELVYYMQVATPKILINKQLLESDDYELVSQNNLRLDELATKSKTIPISMPEHIEKMILFDINKKYLLFEDGESKLFYDITFKKDNMYIQLKNPSSRTSNNVHKILSKKNMLLLEDFLPKENTLYNSLLALFEKQNIKIEEVLLHDMTHMGKNNEITINSNIQTMSLLLKKGKRSGRFLVPSSEGVSFAIQLGEMYIQKPKPSKEDDSIKMYN